MPNRLISPLTRLQIISPKPLDLSLSPLEKKVLKGFKDHVPVHKISKDSQLDIADVYKIINKKKIIKIKIQGRYSPEIKYRIQEARSLGITIEKIAEIFNLEKYRVIYIDRCNRSVFPEQLERYNRAVFLEQLERYNRAVFLEQLERYNKNVLIEQLAPFITFDPKSLHLQVMHKLKKHCINRHYPNQALKKT